MYAWTIGAIVILASTVQEFFAWFALENLSSLFVCWRPCAPHGASGR